MSRPDSDPVATNLAAYTRSAEGWVASAGAVDRAAWAPGYDSFAEFAPLDGLVLDLGCGPGFDAPGLVARGYRLVGVDLIPDMLHFAQTQAGYGGRLVAADMRHLPFAVGRFGSILATGSVHHVAKSDLPSLLTELRRVLRPNGVLSASVERGQGEGLSAPGDGVVDPRFYAYYEADELSAFARAAGFAVLRCTVNGATERSRGFISILAKRI